MIQRPRHERAHRSRASAAFLTAALTGTLLVAGGSGADAGTDAPPPWSQCAFRDHPAAADLVPLISPIAEVSPDVVAVLLGEVAVGTDCSLYDLPV